jgi:hypothetical protein
MDKAIGAGLKKEQSQIASSSKPTKKKVSVWDDSDDDSD